jgi:hypothetical protein
MDFTFNSNSIIINDLIKNNLSSDGFKNLSLIRIRDNFFHQYCSNEFEKIKKIFFFILKKELL